MKRLEGKHVLLGVTGSIAAYKACEILRLLQREGAEIQVVMTNAAQHFITPLTFETLSGREVITELFSSHHVVKTRHISVAEWAECVLIAPATANIIGKVASGIADDFLTTTILAARSPVIFAPAMDYQMVKNPIYLSNCEKLEKLGYQFIAPEEGELASGAKGYGRLASYGRILDKVKLVLLGSETLKGVKVLVTAGPTQEFLDPVRYITNPSTGKMGYALAEEAALRGAEVTLISGPTELRPFGNVVVEKVQSAAEMANAVIEEWSRHQVLIMAAAVADYRPSERSPQKLKKGKSDWLIKFERTDDILSKIALTEHRGVVVGFALETHDGEKRAIEKLKDKKLDLICLNNPTEEGSGFGSDTNKVTLFDRKGRKESLPLMPKWRLAQVILDRVEAFIAER